MRVCWAGSFYRIPRSGLTHVPRAVRGCAAAQVFNNVIASPACCWSARTSASNLGEVPSIGKRRMPSRAQRSAFAESAPDRDTGGSLGSGRN